MASTTVNNCIATDWLEEDHLMLLECWARDGYTYQDIANRIGIDVSTLKVWRAKYPDIEKALKTGREIIDYRVENALLKSALGYRTKETKVITVMQHGRVIETRRETTEKEMAPNVSAAQCWLYNRLPKKWRNMNSRSSILEEIDEDTSIHVTVTRASPGNKQNADTTQDSEEDEEWQDEVNSSIEIRKATAEEKEAADKVKAKKKQTEHLNEATKVEHEAEDDLDYWPDDWEDEDDWEE
ncbi:MAG: helix-turn-helix domain-containing protein [Roseburia sp.]